MTAAHPTRTAVPAAEDGPATYGRIAHKNERVPDVVKEVLERLSNTIDEITHE